MQTKLPKNALRNGAIAGSISAVVVLVVTASLRLALPSLATEAKPKDNPSAHIQIAQLLQPPTINGDCNVIGSGNSIQGGINCPRYGPNPPKFELGQQTIKPRSDGTFDLVVMTNFSSQTLVKLLYVSVEGPDMLDFQFEPEMSGVSSNWYGTMNDDGAKALGYQNPQPGPYVITIHTKTQPTAASRISIRWEVVQN
jgi:hypothetical protein